MGTHIDEAKRLQVVEDAVRLRNDEARKRGWQVGKGALVSTEDFEAFLDKLIESEEVVDTEGIGICADDEFKVRAGAISVDHRAPIEKIIAFLKE